MSSIRAVLFDAGGTLIHPARPVGETYARFARRHGARLDAEATTAAFRLAMKNASPRSTESFPTDGCDRIWWKQVVKNSIADPEFVASPRFETFFEEVYLHYALPEAWRVYPEVPEVLMALRAYSLDLGVLSNWDARLYPVLAGHGLGSIFQCCFISAELGREKPDPEIYRYVAKKIQFPPESILSVGDDLRNDVEAPRQAGWKAVHIDRPRLDLREVLRTLEEAK